MANRREVDQVEKIARLTLFVADCAQHEIAWSDWYTFVEGAIEGLQFELDRADCELALKYAGIEAWEVIESEADKG